MTVDSPDVHTFTGAYALNALSADERELFEHHLAVCDACANEVAEFHETAAKLATASAAAPPVDMRARVLQQVDQTRQAPPILTTERPRAAPSAPSNGRWRAPWLAATAAAVAALIFATADVGPWHDDISPAAAQMAELMASADARIVESSGPERALSRLVVSADAGQAALIVSGWPSAPTGHTFQMWFIGPDGAQPAGTFGIDTDGRAVQTLTGQLDDVDAIGITVEPSGGSTTPTSEPIALFEL